MKFTSFPPFLLAIAVLGFGPFPSKAEPPLSPLLAQANAALSEEKILSIMEQIQRAEAEEDVEALMAFLAPFVVSQVSVDSGNQRTRRTIEGLGAHRNILQASYNRSRSTEQLSERMYVRFDDDGNIAIVTRYTMETANLTDNQRIISMGKDIIRFALVDGEPKIISVVTDGWSEERP